MEKAVRQRIREGHAAWSVLTVRGAWTQEHYHCIVPAEQCSGGSYLYHHAIRDMNSPYSAISWDYFDTQTDSSVVYTKVATEVSTTD
ncbi:hypothetical protein M513_00523 [Trichuris suis]|uniref:Uncharacterized protein n=1 Tax=Trichuris suis TaxID=68888 RepID=A0A085MNN4_9BILA|nr:hypothetical protein M513_00523 [Trichuris suis]